ncbi:hypothetical protein RN001_016323 [Aquatica leii]|uniref:Uncharacterized protein n=1 Tax=Aquatica leii TaxID=1421715 RepID=A0AAN7NXS6_9COLE|nr:hypothetical protein RN001_016323 [Aquatica leii]
MYRLLVLASLIILSNGGVVRVPKIYNALISTDENLSPSHAIPVIEPVLRTTALGVAFPPIFVHQALHEYPEKVNQNENKDEIDDTLETSTDAYLKSKPSKEDKKPIIPQLTYQGSLYPLAIDSYIPYSYTSELLFPALPYYHQPIFIDLEHFNKDNVKKNKEVPSVANFKKNPEIPDVPPPPLPVKDKTKQA